MDRNEAMLRELNLFPQWKRRELLAASVAAPAAAAPETAAPVAEMPAPEVLQSAPAEYAEAAQQMAVERSEADYAVEERVAAQADAPAAPSASPLDNLDWPELKRMVRDCTACKLRAGCTQTVFGVGDERADWLFVGEGPGADEDAQGEPFVGQAGKLLDNMLMAINLRRGKNVYIANVVKCRPPGNRTPEADEIATCLPYLKRQIALIRPKLIVALGKTAATALLGRDATLGSLRGTLHELDGIPLVVTFHPAYLLRTPSEKAKAWQDLCFAVQTMQKEQT
ncbi:MAG TPA: uracil-DNA glycosylase [Gallionella sp.]|nr:uracil-DNA glycosylase [Gallionella sp.]